MQMLESAITLWERRSEADMTTTASLARHWWMMAARGALAMAFGLSILAASNVTLPLVVVTFGCYAILDGAWAIVAALKVSRPRWEAWPVVLAALASLGLGVIALWWPFVPSRVIVFVAVWGLLTGLLELVRAWQPLRVAAIRWLFATAGASSIFLAVIILLLPHADAESVGQAIAFYALVFGAVVALAALRFHKSGIGRTPARTA